MIFGSCDVLKLTEKNIIKHVLFICFFLNNFFLLKDYVLWRDVARPILYIRDSETILDLFKIIRYEGTPMFYHSVLWLVSKFTLLTPFIAKAFHLSIHCLILVMIIYVLKIPNIFRLLLLLQIPQIAYVVYMRQYSISILCVLLFTHFYIKKGFNSVWIYLSLFFLTQTTIHSCVVALVLLLFLSLERYNKTKKIFHSYYLIVFLGFILCVIQFIPPSDLIQGLKTWKPLFNVENIFFLKDFLWDVIGNNFFIGIGFLTILWTVFKQSFKENKKHTMNILLCIVLLFIGFYSIGVFKYSFNRHHWLLSYVLISFLLILLNKNKITFKWDKLKYTGLIVLLIISFCNFYRLNKVYAKPFSSGKAAAEYLDKNFPNKQILSKVEFYTEPVILYLKDRNKYFSLGRKESVKYTILNHESVDYTKYKNYTVDLKYSEIINDLSQAPEDILKKEPILILAADKFIDDLNNNFNGVKFKESYSLTPLRDFEGAIFENYRLYLVKHE